MSVFSLALTKLPPSGAWSAHALVSYEQSGALIHIDDDLSLRKIRKAARQLDANSLSSIRLTGDWHSEQQWAFASSFLSVKSTTKIEFCDNSEHDELQTRFDVLKFLSLIHI